jgi:hypothetical protein
MLHRGRIGKPALVVLAGLALALTAGTYARAEEGPHRALRAALYHLKEAKEDLRSERLRPERRERAEKDIERAIREIERGLKEGKIEARFEPAKDWEKGYKDFRHLRAAMVELDHARKEVKEEKGEWARRKELLEAIDDAHKHIKDALDDLK